MQVFLFFKYFAVCPGKYIFYFKYNNELECNFYNLIL